MIRPPPTPHTAPYSHTSPTSSKAVKSVTATASSLSSPASLLSIRVCRLSHARLLHFHHFRIIVDRIFHFHFYFSPCFSPRPKPAPKPIRKQNLFDTSNDLQHGQGSYRSLLLRPISKHYVEDPRHTSATHQIATDVARRASQACSRWLCKRAVCCPSLPRRDASASAHTA